MHTAQPCRASSAAAPRQVSCNSKAKPPPGRSAAAVHGSKRRRMSLPSAIPSLSWSPTSTSRAASTCPARTPSPLSPRSAPRPPSSDYGGFVPSLQRRNRRNSKQIKQEKGVCRESAGSLLICLHCRGRACPARSLMSALFHGLHCRGRDLSLPRGVEDAAPYSVKPESFI